VHWIAHKEPSLAVSISYFIGKVERSALYFAYLL
jgi:hypothetical protein